MLDVFRGLKSLVKISHIQIDSPVFRLHYSITVMVLIAFSLIVTTRQYVGNPIDCVHTKDIPEDVLNTYCWIHSTYALKSMFLKKLGKEVPYPGVGNSEGKLEDRKVYKYYQWVCFVLFAQRTKEITFFDSILLLGYKSTTNNNNTQKHHKKLIVKISIFFYTSILFYAPRWLWKSWEGGKIHALMMDLDIGICSEIEKKQKKKLLLDYLWDNLRFHNWWAYRYYGCELLSLINVVGQMFLMNKFFDGEFMTFGLDVIKHMEADQEDRMDPMIYIFPRMTKCTFYKYGVSGEVERHDAICILPLNVVNEKIYIFLWFWFILLTILTSLTVMYRIIIIFSPRMRVYLLRLRFRLVRRDAIEIIVRRSKMGDWFLLYMLGENIDSIIFRDVMGDLANRLNNNQHHRVPGLKGDIQDA
ncbi:hypothetical protein PVAND_010162 [Polypedilum vanderplanki]|uniref:Innexin n=1 Tax=Polypedilum vanderplanki TaxID=319348 RepID=A0A9J6CF07_POLVA|nr:hypothetical protein PVAND_010162 [Polypedilum vanderplanki]